MKREHAIELIQILPGVRVKRALFQKWRFCKICALCDRDPEKFAETNRRILMGEPQKDIAAIAGCRIGNVSIHRKHLLFLLNKESHLHDRASEILSISEANTSLLALHRAFIDEVRKRVKSQKRFLAKIPDEKLVEIELRACDLSVRLIERMRPRPPHADTRGGDHVDDDFGALGADILQSQAEEAGQFLQSEIDRRKNTRANSGKLPAASAHRRTGKR